MLGDGVKLLGVEPMGVGQHRLVGLIGQLIQRPPLQLKPGPFDRAAAVFGNPHKAHIVAKRQQRREGGTTLQLLLDHKPLGWVVHPQTREGIASLQMERHAAA